MREGEREKDCLHDGSSLAKVVQVLQDRRSCRKARASVTAFRQKRRRQTESTKERDERQRVNSGVCGVGVAVAGKKVTQGDSCF